MSLRSSSSALRAALQAAPRVQASSFATSSRVGLDFTLPRPSPVPTAPVAASPTRSKTKNDDHRAIRWEPLSDGPFRMASGEALRAPTHTLSVMSTRNNILLTLSDRTGPLFPTISGGTDLTFKKAARSGYEAAHQAALKMFAKITSISHELRMRHSKQMLIRIAYKGIQGQGREAVHQAIAGPDGEDIRMLITRVEDRTPIKVGGTRARKPRRL